MPQFTNPLLFLKPGEITTDLSVLNALPLQASYFPLFSLSDFSRRYFGISQPSPLITNNVPVSRAALLQANSAITSFSISDTSANVAASFDALNAATKLTGITLTTPAPLPITASQLSRDTFVEGKLPGSARYSLSAVTASDAAGVQANPLVASFSVTDTVASLLATPGLAGNPKLTEIGVADTAANMLGNLPALASYTRLTSLTLTGDTTLPVSAAQYASYARTLDLLVSADRLAVAGVAVAGASAVQADAHVGSFTVSDTAALVQAGLLGLNGDTKLTSITLTNASSISVTSGQYFSTRIAIDKLAPGYTATVSGVSTANSGAVGGDPHVGSFSVSDTLANIGTALGALETHAKARKLTAISVTDSGQTLVLSPVQYAAYADAIALMKGSYSIVQGAGTTHLAINIIWDPSTANAPAAWKSGVQYAINYMENLITTPITVNLRVGYGEAGGYTLGSGILGEEVGGAATYISASQFKANLQNSVASNATVRSALAHLSGGSNLVYITGAQEKAFGLLPANGSEVDASIGFAVDPNQTLFAYAPTARALPGKFDFIGVVEHEISHALGRVSYVGAATGLDLFRYSAPGKLAPAGSASYFSIDGGVTNLDNFALTGDTGDWASSAGADANNAYAPSNSVNLFSAADIAEMNVLGFSLSTTPPSATSSGSGVSASIRTPSSASAVASAVDGLNAPALSFIGTPDAITFSASVTHLSAVLPPASGIEEIGGLQYGQDSLAIDLSGLPGILEVFDTLVDGAQAIALAGSDDLSHGLVLTGLAANQTAADLIAHHLWVTGSLATIA